jgi:hypothetical protein
MPQINITENSPNLSGAVQSQGSSHVSVFMCGASFMQKLTEGDSPVPAYKQYNSPQELIAEFDSAVLAGTSSGFSSSPIEKGFTGGSTLDRELHSALNYLEYGGILIAATGATSLAASNIKIDSSFYERKDKFNEVVNLVNLFEDVIGIVGSSFEFHNGTTGLYPIDFSSSGFFGLTAITGVSGSTFDNNIFSVIGRKERARLYGGETANIPILMVSDAAGCLARTDSSFFPWYAPAGTIRGEVNTITKLYPSIDDTDITNLQGQFVNAFNNVLGIDGIYLLGDKTCELTVANKQQIGITRLINYVNRQIKPIVAEALFELNDAETRSKITAALTSIMEFIKSGRGVSSYVIVCDDTNNPVSVQEARQIVVDLSFKPVFSINQVSFRFVINQS